MRIFRTIQVLALAAMSAANAQQPAALDQADTVTLNRRAAEFMTAGEFAQAIPLFKVIVSRSPNNARAMSELGRAAAESGDHALAVQTWARYRELQPDDRRATEQLIQAYQGLGELVERDHERARLFAYRQSLAEGLRASYSIYTRDQFNAGGRKIRVAEYFEPRGSTGIEYTFDSRDTDGSGMTRYSVGSYVVTADTATETGQVRKGERLYYLDKYEAQQISTLLLMKDRPSYEAMRSAVTTIVEAANTRPVLATTGQGPAGGLTDIILERTWCFGACPIDELVLHVDGTAAYTGTENTVLRGTFSGSFPKEEFDRLARWLVAEGFLEMKGSYGRPNADTPTQVIRVGRGADRKAVINNSIDSSEIVAGMERVIRGVATDIRWQPVRSGIRAVATWKPPGEDWRPLSESQILVYPADGKQELTLRTDAQGRFEIPLLPGTYKIEPFSFGRSYPLAKPPKLSPYLTTVVVQPDKFVEAEYRFDRETGTTSIIGR